MSIYEAVGYCWVLLTSTLMTVEILYLAFVGLRVTVRTEQERRERVTGMTAEEISEVVVREGSRVPGRWQGAGGR